MDHITREKYTRNYFTEPLQLAESHTFDATTEDATQEAVNMQRKLAQLKEEKERKLAEFQKRVQTRIRDLKKQTEKEKMNDTLAFNDAENILMKCTDPMRKAPVVQSSSIIIAGKTEKPIKKAKEVEVLSNQYARSKLAKFEIAKEYMTHTLPMPQSDSEKENESKSKTSITSSTKTRSTSPMDQSTRVHRITESRRAYSLLQREQTRERQKALKHKKEVKMLQKKAEKERRDKEKAVNEALAKMSVEAVETEPKVIEEKIRQTVQKNKKISSQTTRMIKRLKSRVSNLQNPVPALCLCDADILKTGPGLCAVNCRFYSNPKSFATILSAVVDSYSDK